MSEREVLLFEAVKLANFLANNQLVQANAIAQKLEAMIQKVVVAAEKPEAHKYWPLFHAIIRVKNNILSGKTSDAHKDAKFIGDSL
jgi:hypothetical protein